MRVIFDINMLRNVNIFWCDPDVIEMEFTLKYYI